MVSELAYAALALSALGVATFFAATPLLRYQTHLQFDPLRFASFRTMLALLVFVVSSGWSVETREVESWYDSLGYPNVKDLPYVRVTTGLYVQYGNKTPENRYTEGFLIKEDPEAFTVFICNLGVLSHWPSHTEPSEPLTTVRFVRKADGPAYQQVKYEVLDFSKAAEAALERVRTQMEKDVFKLQFGNRVRIFALGRACRQKGLESTAVALMDIAVQIPDEQNGKVEPEALLAKLRDQIGQAVFTRAERDMADGVAWADLLKTYASFDTQFPGCSKVDEAQEAARVLRQMIAEDAAHAPKPPAEMTPAEQIAEEIYQLRNLRIYHWTLGRGYPVYEIDPGTKKETRTPIHRLVDFGDAAVPQLIEALDDRRFSRSNWSSLSIREDLRVMRVADLAQRVLEHFSGRNFYPRRDKNGQLIDGTTKQQAEAWWKEKQSRVSASSSSRRLRQETCRPIRSPHASWSRNIRPTRWLQSNGAWWRLPISGHEANWSRSRQRCRAMP